MAFYKKMNLMLIEPHIREIIKEYESVTLYDEDLCELHLENLEDNG